MHCEDFEEISGAYSLDATTAQENQWIEAHLAHCQRCQGTLRELRQVAGLLPLSLSSRGVRPSPLVKDRLLAKITEIEARKFRAAPPLPQPIRRRKPSFIRRTALLVAAAIFCLILSIGLGAWNILLQQQLSFVSANNSVPITYALSSTSPATGMSGQVVYFPQQHLTTILIQSVTPLPEPQVYQGWLLQGNKPTSIGLFTIQKSNATLSFLGDLRDYDTAAISLEPGPGASQNTPKGEIVLSGSLQGKKATLDNVVFMDNSITDDNWDREQRRAQRKQERT
jgi:anti-sigma-K factor RskA